MQFFLCNNNNSNSNSNTDNNIIIIFSAVVIIIVAQQISRACVCHSNKSELLLTDSDFVVVIKHHVVWCQISMDNRLRFVQISKR